MRKATMVGVAVVGVCLLFAINGPEAQRISPSPDAAASRPTQVEVTNFPVVQPVNGSVNVGNLPLGPDGELRVTMGPSSRHLFGFTEAQVAADQGYFPLTRACHAEFSGSIPCTTQEVIESSNLPSLPTGVAWVRAVPVYNVTRSVDGNTAIDVPTGIEGSTPPYGYPLSCNSGFGILVDQDGRFTRSTCSVAARVACCGY